MNTVVVPARQATQAGVIDSLESMESILGLLNSLKIRAQFFFFLLNAGFILNQLLAYADCFYVQHELFYKQSNLMVTLKCYGHYKTVSQPIRRLVDSSIPIITTSLRFPPKLSISGIFRSCIIPSLPHVVQNVTDFSGSMFR
jgi:hypothetical protein